jgi:hypothetical protein
MGRDRRVLLQLVALGRITPAEAERLSMAWNDRREEAWVLAGCLGIALLAQVHPLAWGAWFAPLGHVWSQGSLGVLHHGVSLFTHLLGGIV